jgi:hypothetical protein
MDGHLVPHEWLFMRSLPRAKPLPRRCLLLHEVVLAAWIPARHCSYGT